MSRESKFLSRVLRHEPQLIGLQLRPGGWVLVDDLLTGMKKAGIKLTREALFQLVNESDKKRFTLSDGGRRIRAAQGHSLDIDLELAPAEPPAILFHGTASANLDGIFAKGLNPGNRKHVHLSMDEDTAIKVGRRHGKPIVLRVDAGQMHADGLIFLCADNGVWLTDHVAAEYLGF